MYNYIGYYLLYYAMHYTILFLNMNPSFGDRWMKVSVKMIKFICEAHLFKCNNNNRYIKKVYSIRLLMKRYNTIRCLFNQITILFLRISIHSSVLLLWLLLLLFATLWYILHTFAGCCCWCSLFKSNYSCECMWMVWVPLHIYICECVWSTYNLKSDVPLLLLFQNSVRCETPKQTVVLF